MLFDEVQQMIDSRLLDEDRLVETMSRVARTTVEAALAKQNEQHKAELARRDRKFQEFSEKQAESIYAGTSQFMDRVLTLLVPEKHTLQIPASVYSNRVKEIRAKDRKLRNQREQLQNFQEKLKLMKTWRGIFRTIGQKLGVSR